MGDDQEHTRQILADLIRHPNAAGVLVLGLGCENSNIEELKTANEQIVHSIETISAISEEVSAHANETMSAQEDNSDVLNKITDRMQQLIELTKQEA